MLIGRRVVLIRSLLPCPALFWSNLIYLTLLCSCLVLCFVLLYCVLFCSVLPCHFLSRVVSCCTDSYRIVSVFYCSILYAILRHAPLCFMCYTAQCTLYSFLRRLCVEALPYCSVLVYPLKYIIIHQIYHAPWCVRNP